MTALAPVLEAFFTERLAQRQASPHTVASYRDTFCLVLRYAHKHLGKPPSRLDFADLDAPLIGAFLAHLEAERGNSITTRNNRLAALHSLFSYAALRCPEHAALISRVLAIPSKRADTTLVSFLTPAETAALLAAPDRGSWLGRRDHVLLLVAVQTGLRVSELTGLDRGDVTLGTGANLRCRGKGRKERRTPLTRATARIVADWLSERDDEPAGRPGILDEHKPCLRECWNAGCANVLQFNAEITTRGYCGSHGTVRDYLQPFRALGTVAPARPAAPKASLGVAAGEVTGSGRTATTGAWRACWRKVAAQGGERPGARPADPIRAALRQARTGTGQLIHDAALRTRFRRIARTRYWPANARLLLHNARSMRGPVRRQPPRRGTATNRIYAVDLGLVCSPRIIGRGSRAGWDADTGPA